MQWLEFFGIQLLKVAFAPVYMVWMFFSERRMSALPVAIAMGAVIVFLFGAIVTPLEVAFERKLNFWLVAWGTCFVIGLAAQWMTYRKPHY